MLEDNSPWSLISACLVRRGTDFFLLLYCILKDVWTENTWKLKSASKAKGRFATALEDKDNVSFQSIG